MENEIILALKNISIETLIIAFIVFSLTMLLKWPIKRMTSKFNEEKRKAINTLIILIPALLSLVLSILYYGLINNSWFCKITFETCLSSYLLSLSIYAIFARIVILFKGVLNGKVKFGDKEQFETISEIKDEIVSTTKLLNSKNDKIKEIVEKIQELKNLKQSIEDSKTTNSLIPIKDIDETILKLEKSISEIENEKILVTL